jgi:nucleotide-binding universal stress UspA family protein
MRMLIAVDGSEPAALAARSAMRLTKAEDRAVDLLCVAPTYLKKDRNRKSYEKRILLETTQILEAARSEIGDQALTVKCSAGLGSAAATIVEETPNYDLTVIGAKGWGTNVNVGLGPVSSRIAEHALGAVLIGREIRSETGLRVLVPVDGSTASNRAINALHDFIDLSGAEITLLHVAETPWVQLGLEEDWVTADEEEQEHSDAGVFEKELVREAEDVIEQARRRLATARATVSTRVEEGNPGNEILSEIDRGEYDLVVVGATGTRDLKHQMLGSVSAKIAWDAPCSVLLVREPEEA